MKRLARCAIAALLAASFAAPVLASPPPVKASVASVAPVVTSASLPTLIVSVATVADPPIPKPVLRFAPTPAPAPAVAYVYELAPTPVPKLQPKPVTVPARVAVSPSVADAQAYALSVLGAAEYRCLYSIIQGESRWRPYVWNTKGSGAYGLGQAKPASKMAPYGADYMTNAVVQVKWAIGYGQKRYGTLCAAAAFRSARGWW